ncbi:hypothetical protein ACOACQ_04490 [Nocardioides sp. CPCC 206347]|uniref:hypothetical protein n=1 Tax=Nocardioides sp. CPCC 206347 TaxID=3406463 RepID=UPI003B43929B
MASTTGGDVRAVKALGLVRVGVGVAMMAAPRLIGRSDDPSFVLLLRTIGVRDLVIGAGTVAAPASATALWGCAALASDSIDVAVGAASTPMIGLGPGLVATLLPVPFAAFGAWAVRRALG